MADLLFEVDDGLMAKLDAIARGRGQNLEQYVRELIVAEAGLDADQESQLQST